MDEPTDDQLLAWGFDRGLDLRDLDELCRAAAAGFTTLLWRSTHLEALRGFAELRSIVAGTTDRDDGLADHVMRQWNSLVDLAAWTLGDGGDRAEALRIHTVVAGRCVGLGYPDDIVTRAAWSTTATILAVLRDELGTDATTPGAEVAVGLNAVARHVSALRARLTDPTRPVEIGGERFDAGVFIDGFGADGGAWARYCSDVHDQLRWLSRYGSVIGHRRVLWFVAVSAATDTPGQYPMAPWAAGVDAVAHRDAGWAATGAEQPQLLNGRQVQALVNDQDRWVATTAALAAARGRLGALPDSERLGPFETIHAAYRPALRR